MPRPAAITPALLPQIERLASLGLNDAAIAGALKVSKRTFRGAKRGESGVPKGAVLAALEKGRLAGMEEAAADIRRHAKKSFVAAIYRAKVLMGRDDPAWLPDKPQASSPVAIQVLLQAGISEPKRVEPAPIEIDAEPD